MKKDRERLELTFGAKDADLWAYLKQTGLPKASVAKQLMRAGIEAKSGTVVQHAAVPNKVGPVEKEVDETVADVVEPVKEVVEDKPVKEDHSKEKKPGMFGGLATKR